MKLNQHGFNFVELTIVLALSLILISNLSRLLVITHHDQMQQRILDELYNDANTASLQLKQDLIPQNSIHCLPSSYAITNLSETSIIPGSIKIFKSDNPSVFQLLPKTIQKKLLPHSDIIISQRISNPEIAVQWITPTILLSNEDLNATKENLFLLHDCHQAWLFQASAVYHRNQQTKITLPRAISNTSSPLSLTTWQQVSWFVMKNSEGSYGLYRLIRPEEKAPVEIVNNVANFQTQILLKKNIPSWHWQTANSTIDWQQLAAIRISLTLRNKQYQIRWPLSITLKSQR